MKNCKVCNKELTRAIYCGSCLDQLKKRKFMLDLKSNRGNRCEICGGVFHPAALDFHHDGDDKIDGVSNLVTRHNWKEAKIESEKCKMVCSNCHRIIHFSSIYDQLEDFIEPVYQSKIVEDFHDEIVKLKNKGMTGREVANKLGFHPVTINNYCNYRGIKSKWLGFKQDKYEDILRLRKEGNSYQQISNTVGVSKRTAMNVIKRFGDSNEN